MRCVGKKIEYYFVVSCRQYKIQYNSHALRVFSFPCKSKFISKLRTDKELIAC